jgi:lipoyl(octanoyl) transferase
VSSPIEGHWLGRLPYRDAWALQHRLVAQRAAGEIPDQLLLLEHEAVLTLGRNADPAHVRVLPALLEERGIELIRVERGGEVTYHGPGQLIAYPILRLADRELLIRPYVRALEAAMAETAAAYGVSATRRDGLPGLWVDAEAPLPRKLGAIGVRVEHGVTYHGIALNVTTDLRDFDLIDPCGLPNIGVTTIAREGGWPTGRQAPATDSVAEAAAIFAASLARLLDADLLWIEWVPAAGPKAPGGRGWGPKAGPHRSRRASDQAAAGIG